jgi:cold shock protein
VLVSIPAVWARDRATPISIAIDSPSTIAALFSLTGTGLGRNLGGLRAFFLERNGSMPQGTIKKLIADKGFGFISGERGEVFFHHSALDGTTIEELRVGQEVSYEEVQGPKGARAEKVRPL